jgi:ribonuclease VapC
MFIDASAIVAILGREPGYEEIEKRLASTDGPFLVSPLVKFEATVALARQKSQGNAKPTGDLLLQALRVVETFVEDLGADEVAISAQIGRSAIEASAAYGRVVGHVADLNFGDCFAYACAKVLKAPLLYKGNDFAQTDLA